MKFTVQLKPFLDAVNLVSSVVPSRPTHPILGNILMVVKDGEIHLTGFDLVTSVEIKIDALVEVEGRTTIPSKLIQNILSKISEQDVSITLDNEFITLQTKHDVFKVQCYEAEEYPSIDKEDSNIAVPLSKEIVSAIVKKVIPSTSKDETKTILQGVNLKYNDGDECLNVAATTGHCLAWLQVPFEYSDSFELTANPQPFSLISKLNYEGDATLSIGDNKFAIQAGDVKIWSRGYAGSYPNYFQLIPNKFERTFDIDKAQLTSAIDKVAIFHDKPNGGGKLSFSDSLSVEPIGNNPNNGKVQVNLKESVDSFEVGFNLTYLKNAVKCFDTKYVSLYCNGQIQPAIIKDENYIHLIMPVRLDS